VWRGGEHTRGLWEKQGCCIEQEGEGEEEEEREVSAHLKVTS